MISSSALLAPEGPRGATFFRRLLSHLESGKPIVDVGPPSPEIEGAAHGLAEFAIIDDVDAALRLALQHLGNRGAQPRQKLAVWGIVPVELDQMVGPRKAAYMGSQDTIDASLHVRFSRGDAPTVAVRLPT